MEKILNIIYEAGKIMLSAKGGCPEGLIHSKEGTFNYVTEYDSKIQRFLEKELLQVVPDAHFLAEEDGEDNNAIGAGYTFIIDPIDGTSNFIHDYGESAISVALLYDKEPVFGAVYLPFKDEMFYAEKGKGAYKNGKPISVSKTQLKDSLTLVGTAPYVRDKMCDATMEMIKELFLNSVDIRRGGSAASDLCYIACGRAACYCELNLSPWDHAAGAFIVKEAGGYVTTFDGSALPYNRRSTVFASNAVCREQAELMVRKITEKWKINW